MKENTPYWKKLGYTGGKCSAFTVLYYEGKCPFPETPKPSFAPTTQPSNPTRSPTTHYPTRVPTALPTIQCGCKEAMCHGIADNSTSDNSTCCAGLLCQRQYDGAFICNDDPQFVEDTCVDVGEWGCSEDSDCCNPFAYCDSRICTSNCPVNHPTVAPSLTDPTQRPTFKPTLEDGSLPPTYRPSFAPNTPASVRNGESPTPSMPPQATGLPAVETRIPTLKPTSAPQYLTFKMLVAMDNVAGDGTSLDVASKQAVIGATEEILQLPRMEGQDAKLFQGVSYLGLQDSSADFSEFRRKLTSTVFAELRILADLNYNEAFTEDLLYASLRKLLQDAVQHGDYLVALRTHANGLKGTDLPSVTSVAVHYDSAYEIRSQSVEEDSGGDAGPLLSRETSIIVGVFGAFIFAAVLSMCWFMNNRSLEFDKTVEESSKLTQPKKADKNRKLSTQDEPVYVMRKKAKGKSMKLLDVSKVSHMCAQKQIYYQERYPAAAKQETALVTFGLPSVSLDSQGRDVPKLGKIYKLGPDEVGESNELGSYPQLESM